jgi:hypothetical protein
MGPLVLAVSVVVALTLLWRRAHPLAAATVAFGTMIAFDVVRIFVIDATGLLTIAGLLMLAYALFRWGSAVRPRSSSAGSRSPTSPIRRPLPRWSARPGSSCSPPRSAPRFASTPTPGSATSSRPSSVSATTGP